MPERTSAIPPTSDCSHGTGVGQLSVGSATTSPAGDSPLLALEQQFNAIRAELLVVERLRRNQRRSRGPSAQPYEQTTIGSRVEEQTCNEVVTQQTIESVLARLYPIERAIMQTPAFTIAGLGVKARHAAYVMSQYWEAPIDRIDWDARAVRLLVEAVCNVANSPLSLRDVEVDE